MTLVYQELNRLIDDYFICEDLQIKKQILSEIQRLTEVVCLSD